MSEQHYGMRSLLATAKFPSLFYHLNESGEFEGQSVVHGHLNHGGRKYAVTVLTKLTDVLDLREEWWELYENAIDPNPSTNFGFVASVWQVIAGIKVIDLFLICCRCNDLLVALWPLKRECRGSLWSLSNVGLGGGEEYNGPLVRQDCSLKLVLELVAATAYKLGHYITFTLPSRSVLAPHLTHRKLYHRHSVYSPVLVTTQYADFDSWISKKTGSFRKGLRYDRRKLAEIGSLRTLHNDSDSDLNVSVVGWMFHEKQRFMSEDKRQKRSQWSKLLIEGEQLRLVFEQLFKSGLGYQSNIDLWTLMVNSTPAAAAICFDSPVSVEILLSVTNPLFAPRSPGNLLFEDIARDAFKRQKILDFRITTVPYKMRWADAYLPYATYLIATKPYGVLPMIAEELHHRNIAFRKWAKEKLVSLQTRARRLPWKDSRKSCQ